jgi:hypothetical protein
MWMYDKIYYLRVEIDKYSIDRSYYDIFAILHKVI